MESGSSANWGRFPIDTYQATKSEDARIVNFSLDEGCSEKVTGTIVSM